MTAPAPAAAPVIPPTPLSSLLGEQPPRPPWTWANLTDDEAHQLDVMLDEWVGDYNAQLATDLTQVIPACWRQHPALAQTMPVMFWAWWDGHRNPDATPDKALDFHLRWLPAFQERLDVLLEKRGSECRTSHRPADATDKGRHFREAITKAAEDVAARGPDITDVLRGSTFGA